MSDEPTRPRSKAQRQDGAGKSAGNISLDAAGARLIAAIGVGVVVGLLLGALIFGGGDGGDDVASSSASPTAARTVSPAELAREARSLGRPVYWAGPQGGATIELERSPEGNVSVRYIPVGEDPDGPAADYLTIVTYPYPEARAALEQQAAGGDVISRDLPQGGFVISQPDSPTNAYLAYAGEDYQVEVYDPRPGRALKLILEGAVLAAG